jgi:hypothetical protein
MTTSAAARRRSTWVALALVVAVCVAAGTLVVVGAATLANSRAGRDATQDGDAVLTLPVTPTALVGTVDPEGRLASVAALVVDPSGVGGSIVSIPATGDASLDLGDDRFPLDESLAVDGPELFRIQAEALTGISYDVVELADRERVEAMLAPLGTLTVDLPAGVELPAVDGDDAIELDAGEQDVDAALAARLVTYRAADEPVHVLDPVRDAVWAGVADQIGAGIGSASTVGAGASVPRPSDLDDVLDRLYAGTTGWRNVTAVVPPPDRNPRGVDVVVPDRAELLLVFGQIAPGRVAAPNPSLTFRIEAGFTEEELAASGLNNADVARDVINRLLFVQANVVSVVTSEVAAPDVTQVAVADESVVDVVLDSYPLVFGDLEVVELDHRIQGIDVIVFLGRSYLDRVGADPLSEEDLEDTAFEPEDSVPDDAASDGDASPATTTEDG